MEQDDQQCSGQYDPRRGRTSEQPGERRRTLSFLRLTFLDDPSATTARAEGLSSSSSWVALARLRLSLSFDADLTREAMSGGGLREEGGLV